MVSGLGCQMLNLLPSRDTAGAPTAAIWLDLHDPRPDELAKVEAIAGVGVPSRDDLSEIERSSRLRTRGGVLSMSVPMTTLAGGGQPQTAPIGFLLSPERLVTVRFAALGSFDAVVGKFGDAGTAPTSSLEVFVDLCEAIVDHLADSLEQAAAELREMSVATFHTDVDGRHAIRSNRVIRAKLRHVGRLGDRVSETRDSLLGLGRAIDFASGLTAQWSDETLPARMKTLQQDVASLDDYELHLSDKVQFLLDAMVGLIGIAQNDVFKVLTIVSIVGIPPTLIAGIYGMNFKGMPEYDWAWGYPYGLAVIALSAIIPLAWFKWRGWF
jgi:magnesium transporter